jgi:hypothetical protein
MGEQTSPPSDTDSGGLVICEASAAQRSKSQKPAAMTEMEKPATFNFDGFIPHPHE